MKNKSTAVWFFDAVHTKMDGSQAENSGKVSFGFTKKKEAKVLERGTHDSSPRTGKREEPDFVLALEGREVKR